MDVTLSNGWRVQLIVRDMTSNLYLYNAAGMVVLAKQYAYWQLQRSQDEALALIELATATPQKKGKAA